MKVGRKFKKRITIAFISIGLLFAFSFTKPAEKYFEIAKNLEIFASLFNEVNALYVDEVNPNKMMETGIDAMLESLDPYTNYIPEDKVEDFKTLTRGHYGGIGSVIGKRDKHTVILMPYEGSPSIKSGLLIGDKIIKIDGIDVAEKSVDEISHLLRGQAGTDVTISIERYGKEELVEIKLTRERIDLHNVPYSGMLTEDIGYFSLHNFARNAGDDVKDAIKDLKAQGAKKIVFDLRGNSGGLLDEAIKICNLFVPRKKLIVSTKGKSPNWNKEYVAKSDAYDTDIPLVILTDNGSASASEIVSGVIQDYDRGVLIGRKTYGKGLVQQTRQLKYNSQVKITTAKYYIPSGRCIQAIDYSHRNEDGSVGKIPDSLKVAFKTKNGRTVYDGGGIDPDLEIEEKNLAPISEHLIKKGYIFNYATKFHSETPVIAKASEFRLTDVHYVDFMSWLKEKDLNYKSETEELIEKLEKVAKKEKCVTCIENDLKSLRDNILRDKESAVLTHKDEIKELLEKEIVKRYYYSKGEIEASFDDDPDILKAISILNNTEEYNKILAGTEN